MQERHLLDMIHKYKPSSCCMSTTAYASNRESHGNLLNYSYDLKLLMESFQIQNKCSLESWWWGNWKTAWLQPTFNNTLASVEPSLQFIAYAICPTNIRVLSEPRQKSSNNSFFMLLLSWVGKLVWVALCSRILLSKSHPPLLVLRSLWARDCTTTTG